MPLLKTLLDYAAIFKHSVGYKSSQPSILIVEDEPTISLIWSNILREFCSEIRVASSVSEAQTALNHHPADILILDWSLPNGDGQSVLNSWVSNVRGPAAVISGKVKVQTEDMLYQTGAHHVLWKPVSPGMFRAVISRYVRQLDQRQRCEWTEQRLLRLERQQVLWVVMLFVLAILAGERLFSLIA